MKRNNFFLAGRRQFLKSMAVLSTISCLSITPLVAAEVDVLKVRAYKDLDGVDPMRFGNFASEQVMNMIYRKLIQYKPGREWEWQLDAAKSIEQVNPTTIRFELKPGIQFTDGYGEMTAEDVKFSFERIADPANNSMNKGDWKQLQEVVVTGKYTGEIKFKKPFQPAWNITLPYISGAIVSKKAVTEAGGVISIPPKAMSGPYLLKSWKPKQSQVLVRNEDFLGERPDFDEIQIVPIDDEKIAQIAFEAGDLDYTGVSLGSVDILKNDMPANSTLEEYPALSYVWLGMNLDNPKLKDKRVRQAIQYAVDVPSILQVAYMGAAEPSTGIIAPGLLGHREKSLLPPQANVEKARELLDEAGVKSLNLRLAILNKSEWTTAAQVIQVNLAQLGIDVQIDLYEAGTFSSLGQEKAGDSWKNLELILHRYTMTPDPFYATAWFTTQQKGIWNWERFSNPEFDQLHLDAQSEMDRDKRAKMYERMQDLMEESAAYRFLTHEANPVIFKNTIQPAFRPDGLPLLQYFKKAN